MFVYTRRIFPFSIAIRLKNGVFGLILNPIRTGMNGDIDESSMEWQLHIVFSLAKWLIFWGSNGHGYHADF